MAQASFECLSWVRERTERKREKNRSTSAHWEMPHWVEGRSTASDTHWDASWWSEPFISTCVDDRPCAQQCERMMRINYRVRRRNVVSRFWLKSVDAPKTNQWEEKKHVGVFLSANSSAQRSKWSLRVRRRGNYQKVADDQISIANMDTCWLEGYYCSKKKEKEENNTHEFVLLSLSFLVDTFA